ncbi:MAG TPA: MarR family transcriptional regulator [Candidatus Paceibacterota bacterium]|nr:MarR family transcriptional regulator [Candidatus Paceibacterota bacterium]
MKKHSEHDLFAELAKLFFETRQVIRANVAGDKPDPNAWMRFETLRYIDDQGEPTMRDIARYLRITAPSATSLIAHLSREGWIKRVRGVPDMRTVRIVLSAKGASALARYRANSRETMQRVFSRLPATDAEELIRVLRRVNETHRS